MTVSHKGIRRFDLAKGKERQLQYQRQQILTWDFARKPPWSVTLIPDHSQFGWKINKHKEIGHDSDNIINIIQLALSWTSVCIFLPGP